MVFQSPPMRQFFNCFLLCIKFTGRLLCMSALNTKEIHRFDDCNPGCAANIKELGLLKPKLHARSLPRLCRKKSCKHLHLAFKKHQKTSLPFQTSTAAKTLKWFPSDLGSAAKSRQSCGWSHPSGPLAVHPKCPEFRSLGTTSTPTGLSQQTTYCHGRVLGRPLRSKVFLSYVHRQCQHVCVCVVYLSLTESKRQVFWPKITAKSFLSRVSRYIFEWLVSTYPGQKDRRIGSIPKQREKNTPCCCHRASRVLLPQSASSQSPSAAPLRQGFQVRTDQNAKVATGEEIKSLTTWSWSSCPFWPQHPCSAKVVTSGWDLRRETSCDYFQAKIQHIKKSLMKLMAAMLKLPPVVLHSGHKSW